LLVGPGAALSAGDKELPKIRRAIRAQRKLDITYRDLKGAETSRTVWPFALGFFERVRVLVCWCEMREAIRHFRTDRITALVVSRQPYSRSRQQLLAEWRAQERVSGD
jgi:predicted DNA-binding transcriptional regulator YafY